MPRPTDELDWDIVKEIISPASMRWNVREPYSRMAKRLAVDEETVRRRLVRLRESGIIGDFVLFLNPGLLGRKNGLLYLDAKDYTSISRAIPKLKLMDGIVSLTSVHEAGLLVSTYYQGESAFARQMALVESVCEGRTAMHWTAPYPEFGGPLMKTDWIILQALRRNPRRKLSDLASSIGISSRTVNRRMKRLNDGMAMFLFLEFDLARIQGLRYFLLVHCENEEKKKEVDETIISGLQSLVYTETWAPNHSMFAFACENIIEADRVSSWLRKLSGVSDMRLGILKSRVHNMDWIDEEIGRRISSF
ncbi:MAG TPA: AsnC family transcriptional regulator [Candidatus Acidoferrales bacterium]|nr:AsnC family transcriptional regulator [Candidatus Acidoferrales bacterium]